MRERALVDLCWLYSNTIHTLKSALFMAMPVQYVLQLASLLAVYEATLNEMLLLRILTVGGKLLVPVSFTQLSPFLWSDWAHVAVWGLNSTRLDFLGLSSHHLKIITCFPLSNNCVTHQCMFLLYINALSLDFWKFVSSLDFKTHCGCKCPRETINEL